MLKPLNNKVLLQRSEVEEKTESGIILTDAAQDIPQKGKIIALVEEGYYNVQGNLVTVDLKVGDEVYFGKYSGQEIKFEGENYLVMDLKEIICKIG